ncbi:MAG: cupin domain-containing protein [Nocardioidaceae bacterium]
MTATIPTPTRTAAIRQAGEGEQRWFAGGGVFTWKATCADTDGAMLMFEDHLEGGKVTPMHFHPDADETFCMLDGEIKLVIDGEETVLGAGGVAVIPRNVPHAFMVKTPTARMLCVQTPGDGEEFYMNASDPAETAERVVDFKRIAQVAEETGAIVIVGPPPFGNPAGH